MVLVAYSMPGGTSEQVLEGRALHQQIGLLNSLQQLGCQHTLSKYLGALPQQKAGYIFLPHKLPSIVQGLTFVMLTPSLYIEM